MILKLSSLFLSTHISKKSQMPGTSCHSSITLGNSPSMISFGDVEANFLIE
jgi:hypothetical protein